MKTDKSMVAEIRNLGEIKGMMEVYEELAAGKMQKIRQFILSGRDFFENLEKLSDEVGSDISSATSTDSKMATVLVSANTGLYGDIIDKTFKIFLDFINQNQTKVYLIGKLGEKMMRSYAPQISCQGIDFPDDAIEPKKFDAVLKKLSPYKKVVIFYGKFYNIAIQHPFVSLISGKTLSKTINPEDLTRKRFSYLYEPSMDFVAEIFTEGIFSSMLEQILRESQLAKQGSRLMHLDQTIGNIEMNLTKLAKQKMNLHKKLLNRKQNAMISGMMARGMN